MGWWQRFMAGQSKQKKSKPARSVQEYLGLPPVGSPGWDKASFPAFRPEDWQGKRYEAFQREETRIRRMEEKLFTAINRKQWKRVEELAPPIISQGSYDARCVTRNQLGLALYHQGRVEEAITAWEAVVAEQFDGALYWQLAVAYRKLHRYADEIRIIELALARHRGNHEELEKRLAKAKLLA